MRAHSRPPLSLNPYLLSSCFTQNPQPLESLMFLPTALLNLRFGITFVLYTLKKLTLLFLLGFLSRIR